MKLEQLQTNAAVRGIVPDALITVVSVQWFGSEALELTYKTVDGRVDMPTLSLNDRYAATAVVGGAKAMRL